MYLITNPSEIANAFDDYFAKVAIDLQSSIRFSDKKFSDCLQPLNIISFLEVLLIALKSLILLLF